MQNSFKAIVAYDGTRYSGWLEQPGRVTVLGQLRNAFERAFACPPRLLGSSKTDAGVHALGQVLRITVPLSLPVERIAAIWNKNLPEDILVRSVCKAPADFHPYRAVAAKVYRYYISPRHAMPMLARYAWHVRQPFDRDLLSSSLQQFSGTHDFRSFCSAAPERDTMRTIDHVYCSYMHRFGLWRIEIRGKRFLHFMVRRMVAAAVMVAQRPGMSSSAIAHALAHPHAQQHFGKAPAQGLFLHKVIYYDK